MLVSLAVLPDSVNSARWEFTGFHFILKRVCFLSQALMGIQLVVSLLAASIMQRMAPHCSFARWLLCNGRYDHSYSQVIHESRNMLCTVYVHMYFVSSSLCRFKHPSEGELCALAGKQMPKQNRRDRWESGDGVTAAEFYLLFHDSIKWPLHTR